MGKRQTSKAMDYAPNHLQHRFLRAGRMLIAGGFVVVTHATVGSQAAASALVGFALLLLGVSLIMLPPVVAQFQFPAGAAQVGAAAIADAALLYLFPPPGN